MVMSSSSSITSTGRWSAGACRVPVASGKLSDTMTTSRSSSRSMPIEATLKKKVSLPE